MGRSGNHDAEERNPRDAMSARFCRNLLFSGSRASFAFALIGAGLHPGVARFAAADTGSCRLKKRSILFAVRLLACLGYPWGPRVLV
jgi:hypothetical protein